MSFLNVYPLLIQDEGKKLEQVAGDSGGLTFCGIDIASNPDWAGWPQVKADAAAGIDPTANTQSMALVQAFYESKWAEWDLDYIPEILQPHIYGTAINEGASSAFKMLQAAVLRQGVQVAVDGQVGPATLSAIGKCNAEWLLDSFCWIRAQAYLTIADNHINDQQFLRGWLNREVSGL